MFLCINSNSVVGFVVESRVVLGPVNICRVKWKWNGKRVKRVDMCMHAVKTFLRHFDITTATFLNFFF